MGAAAEAQSPRTNAGAQIFATVTVLPVVTSRSGSSAGCLVLGRGFRRLAEAKSQRLELADLAILELGVPVLYVSHRVVEPLQLVLRSGLQYTTTNYVLEELIAGLLERC